MLRRRIALAVASLAALVLVAAGAGVIGQRTASGHLGDTLATDRDIATALMLSLAVRDVYAHQAHTIILNDRSHLDHYRDTVAETTNLLVVLEGFLARWADDEDRQALAALRRDIRVLDESFHATVVPAIGGPSAMLVAPHETALSAIDRITHTVDRLTTSLRRRVEATRHTAQEETGIVSAALVGAAIVAVLVALGISLRMLRRLGPRLAALERGAQRFAEGDLAHRIPLAESDELTALARQMNTMASDLERHQTRLVQAERLASVGRVAAGVAHEVNNPLAAILGFARLIERVPEVAADAARIVREAEQCRDIVSGLLDLARPPQLNLVPVSVADLADLIADVGESLEAIGFARTDVVVEGTGSVSADPAKLRQVLVNLVKNAHEAGGPVRVSIRGGAERVTVIVSDHGPGVGDAEHLFEPFHSTKGGGTGLGLAVSRALVRRHGGDLVFAGTNEGVTEFALSLPALTLNSDGPWCLQRDVPHPSGESAPPACTGDRSMTS